MKSVCLREQFEGLNEDRKFAEYRRLWSEAGGYRALNDFPLHLDIELCGKCNLRCEHCFQNGLITEPLGFMEFDLYRKIIDESTPLGLCALKLQVRGESFLHPRLFECIAYAKQAGALDVQITTNGTLLDESRMESLLASGLDGIIFSVDAHHGDSYVKHYRIPTYSPVEQAVKHFLDMRAAAGKSRPWVRLQTALPRLNADIMEKTREEIRMRFPLADIIVINRMQDFREGVDVYPDLGTSYRFLPCSYLMHRLAVYWNGDVTVCCVDYNNRFKLGNAARQSIQEIWLSDKMQEFRRIHESGNREAMAPCKHCHACTIPTSRQNVMDSTPRHYAEHAGAFRMHSQPSENPSRKD